METISIEEADQLVLEHKGWAESIARSVARAWNMDWQSDGLDGAALEALIFCARRFDPSRGVPFRGYSRKRIHEASTEAARKTKGWRKTSSAGSDSSQKSREISVELLHIFPELRSGEIPLPEESGDGDGDFRAAIRQLIVGATIVAAKQGISTSAPDEALDYKRLIELLADLEPVHQSMMWKIYWEGDSLRNVADNWETDELNVIREHKALLSYLCKAINTGRELARPRIRPGLKHIAMKLRRTSPQGQFTMIVSNNGKGLS